MLKKNHPSDGIATVFRNTAVQCGMIISACCQGFAKKKLAILKKCAIL